MNGKESSLSPREVTMLREIGDGRMGTRSGMLYWHDLSGDSHGWDLSPEEGDRFRGMYAAGMVERTRRGPMLTQTGKAEVAAVYPGAPTGKMHYTDEESS